MPPSCTLPAMLRSVFSFWRNAGVEEVGLGVLDQSFVVVELRSGDGSVNGLAKETVVAPGNVRGDEFSLAGGESALAAQEDVDELV